MRNLGGEKKNPQHQALFIIDPTVQFYIHTSSFKCIWHVKEKRDLIYRHCKVIQNLYEV